MKAISLVSQIPVTDHPADFFKECHAATCVRNNAGDLLAAYFAGETEGAPDVGIWISRRIGGIWQDPVRVRYFYGVPHWNPILHMDGDKVCLYYKVGPSPREWYTMVCESRDFGITWSESVEAIPDDHTSRLASKNKILVAKDGRLLAGNSFETLTHWDCSIDISADGGKTWETHPIALPHPDTDPETTPGADGIIQPALWQSDALTFHCLLRSSRGYIYRSDSTDGGNTWCEAYPTDFPNNNSGITLTSLEDGTLVLVCNPVSENWGARTPLTIYTSQDNGASWIRHFDLETDPYEYSYPYLFGEGAELELVYTWRRKNIIHCSFKTE